MMGKKSDVKSIVILHGWGISGDKYQVVKSILTLSGYQVYTPDLPGFGKNPLIKESLSLEDYTLFLNNFLKEKKITNCVLVGHSFGSRVIAAFLIQYPKEAKEEFDIRGIVFTGAPLARIPLSFRKKVGVLISKTGKKVIGLLPPLNSDHQLVRKFLYRFIGEWDYYKAGPMKKTFVKIVNTDLESKLGEIDLPTLLIWGSEDRVTPFQGALKIKGLIKGASLETIEGATHKLPYENPEAFADKLKSFLDSL